jgi:hypothetical protein
MTPKKLFAGIAAASVLGAGGVTATDAAINPYDTVGQTLQEVSVSTIPEAGENKVILDKTRPKIMLSKFGGELQMGVTYTGMQATGDRKFLSSEVDWSDGDQTMQVIPLAASSTMEDGGYEINIVLNSKPASNVFNFSIDGADQLDFFYQPPLSDDQIKNGASQPENVVGSYAVYYKDHANHVENEPNYATGKAYHIFRPLIRDADGAQAWGTLSYAEGDLSVEVPQDFLDHAVYPVLVDPTFGYTTAGATFQRLGSGGVTSNIGSLFGTHGAATGETITKYSVNGACVNNLGSYAIQVSAYSISGGLPSSILTTARTITISNNTQAWFDSAALTDALNGGVTYGVSIGNYAAPNCNGNDVGAYYDLTSGTQDSLAASGALPSTWSSTGTESRQYSLYATYSPAPPAVTTADVTAVSQTQATFIGNLTSLGGGSPDGIGFRYGTTNTLTSTSSVFDSTSTTGAYSSTVSGLTAGTAYKYESYASSSSGTAFTYAGSGLTVVRKFVTGDYVGSAGSDIGFCYQDGTASCFTGTSNNDLNARLGYRAGANFLNITTGFRFPNITIPKNATITSAKFYYTAFDTDSTSPPFVKIFAEATDNSPTFATTGANSPDTVAFGGSRATTSASVSWQLSTGGQIADTATSSPDISSVIQEVVNRASWTSGNALSIIIGPGDAVDNFNADNATSTAALIISYTTAAAATPHSTTKLQNSTTIINKSTLIIQ